MTTTTLTSDHLAGTRRTTPSAGLASYVRLDLRRQLRDKLGMFFMVGLPAFMYLVFGLGSDDPVGSGNVAMYVMLSMAAYGAVTATTAVAGSAYTEQVMGWGRQLSLTPVRPLQLVVLKTGIAMTVAAVPVGLIFGIGAVTGARGTLGDWLWSAVVIWVGSAVFAIYGLAVCTNLRSQNAVSVASGMIVVLAFLGNVFSPMSGLMLDIGRFSPLYGYAGLARYPVTEGYLPLDAGRGQVWLLLANVAAWTVTFALLALLGVRRSRERA